MKNPKFNQTEIGRFPANWKDGGVFSELLMGFLNNEAFILKHQLNERAISHKLAEYLSQLYKDRYDVDCEYNKMPKTVKSVEEFVTKRLELTPGDISSDDFKGTTVYPDIIVHRRGDNDKNYLVIEVKKKSYADQKYRGKIENLRDKPAREFDYEKLKAYTKKLNYSYGIYIEFDDDKISEISFFKDGEKIDG